MIIVETSYEVTSFSKIMTEQRTNPKPMLINCIWRSALQVETLHTGTEWMDKQLLVKFVPAYKSPSTTTNLLKQPWVYHLEDTTVIGA